MLNNFGRPITLTEGIVETGDFDPADDLPSTPCRVERFHDRPASSSCYRRLISSLHRCVTARAFIFTVPLLLSSRQFGPPRERDDENFHFTVFSSLSSSLRLGLWSMTGLAAALEGKRLEM